MTRMAVLHAQIAVGCNFSILIQIYHSRHGSIVSQVNKVGGVSEKNSQRTNESTALWFLVWFVHVIRFFVSGAGFDEGASC